MAPGNCSGGPRHGGGRNRRLYMHSSGGRSGESGGGVSVAEGERERERDGAEVAAMVLRRRVKRRFPSRGREERDFGLGFGVGLIWGLCLEGEADGFEKSE